MLRLLARLFVLLAFFAAGSAHAVKEYRINKRYPSTSHYTTCVNFWAGDYGGAIGVKGTYRYEAVSTESNCNIKVYTVSNGALYNSLNWGITWVDLQCPAGSAGSATQFLGWLDSDADPDQAEMSDMQGTRPLATSMCNPSGCVVEGLTPSDVYMVHQPDQELSPVMLTWSGTLTGKTCTFSLEAQDDPTDRPPSSGGSGTGSGGDGSGDGTGTGGGDGGTGDGGTGDGSGTGGDGTGTGGGTGDGSGDGTGTGGDGSDGSGDGSDGSGDGTGGGGTSGGGSGGDSGGDGSGDGSGGDSGGDGSGGGSGGDGSGDGSGGGGGGDGDGGGGGDPDNPDNPDEEENPGSPWGSKGTDFYTPKYPNGIGSMWAEKSAAIQSSGLLGWVSGFVPSFGDGGCPTFQMPTIYGNTSTLAVPCDVWAFVKTVILLTALFLARRLVFGG